MVEDEQKDAKRVTSKEGAEQGRPAAGTDSRPSSVNLNEMLSGVQNMFLAAPKSPSTTL